MSSATAWARSGVAALTETVGPPGHVGHEAVVGAPGEVDGVVVLVDDRAQEPRVGGEERHDVVGALDEDLDHVRFAAVELARAEGRAHHAERRVAGVEDGSGRDDIVGDAEGVGLRDVVERGVHGCFHRHLQSR